jgi:hypothetical protein
MHRKNVLSSVKPSNKNWNLLRNQNKAINKIIWKLDNVNPIS